jgi:hypothetical protein
MAQIVIALLLICCCSFAWTQVTENPVESGNAFVRRCASTEKDSTALTEVDVDTQRPVSFTSMVLLRV